MLVTETIQDPLSIVSQLFDKHLETPSASPLDFDPSPYFADLFKDTNALIQIPSLNQVPVTSLPKNGLVRFRCMLQDTGLGQEMFVSAYKMKHENGGEKTLCYRYTDDLMNLMEINQENIIPTDQFMERSIVYCVSPPGETSWVKEASHTSTDMIETLNALNLHEAGSATSSSSAAATLGEKFPLPDVNHISAIVKFYGDVDSLRVGQLVDVIGVLGTTSGIMDTADEEQELFDSHLAQFKDTTVIHAITHTNRSGPTAVPFFTKTQLDDTVKQSREMRGPLTEYIATCVGGDKLVAEYILLQLLSKVSTQKHGMKIGQFSLNITNFQPTTTLTSQCIADVLSSLVLHQVSIPLTLDTLNKSRFSPQSVNENLRSGVLQLVPGTHVLVDESELSEGQLGDTGVRNMQALINAIQHQTLTYGFPYSQFDFDVDLGFITLSAGKSLLPNHCTITMKPTDSLNQAQNPSPTKQQLDAFRMFVQASKHAPYEIPESVSQFIQEDFVKERKLAAEQHMTLPSQEDLMLRMNLCRLVALSFGENALSKETYDYTVQLDKSRNSRNLAK